MLLAVVSEMSPDINTAFGTLEKTLCILEAGWRIGESEKLAEHVYRVRRYHLPSRQLVYPF